MFIFYLENITFIITKIYYIYLYINFSLEC